MEEALVTFRDLMSAFRELEIGEDRPVIAHASLSAFGQVKGGVDTLLGALLTVFPALMMPAFTYKSMLTPQEGPPDNALAYGSQKDQNAMAEFFRLDMPADRLMGVLPEALRRHPQAGRSTHPILSFTGVNVEAALGAQKISEPLAPIRVLTEMGGWALLLGVDHTVNTSIHFGERQAGRRQFIRWALTPGGVQECPGFPGCSDGFQAIACRLDGSVRAAQVGPARLQALPLADLVEKVQVILDKDPLALLCSRQECERCNAVRDGERRQVVLLHSSGSPGLFQ
jgi:aminoglycoside 3-N-acetyltransferase